MELAMRSTLARSLAFMIVPAAAAQTGVDPATKVAWCENIGWTNWADAGAPVGEQSVLLHTGFLSGFVWSENTGWLNLGNGAPTGDCDGTPCYSTANAAETGVNVDIGTGELSGLAWGENIGWINFSGGAMATPPQPAQLDQTSNRLRGYAWGENVGWINLDDAVHFVAFQCTGDFNGSGSFSVQDIFDFLAAYFAGDPQADINASGSLTVQDIFDFLASYFLGCA